MFLTIWISRVFRFSTRLRFDVRVGGETQVFDGGQQTEKLGDVICCQSKLCSEDLQEFHDENCLVAGKLRFEVPWVAQSVQ
jgi:hypothetical protein